MAKSPKPKNRANSLAKWKWALIGSACISLVGIVIGVSVVFGRLREDPPPAIAFQIPGFFPYIHGTIGNSKTDVRQAITFPSTVKWRLLGGDEMLELNGYVFTIYCEEKPYEDNLTATNVRGSHQVYAMSELPVNDQLVQLEIINTCGM
ncbi:hypothetical protein LSH36_337g00036 [Paralvinella palmiformis]|uniref:Uncharacterized protein n=1 Tax=Paralvinella palmiformis TaxID=53620 RepID=A0AAD9JFI1_9ANNE|nr:hypothetical protein LSH36_337g00036 [Paralvinella palmiformis]